MATGPSLSQKGISLLESEFTFGVNMLMDWNGIHFQPTFYGACENIGLTEYILPSAAKAPNSIKFFSHSTDFTNTYDMSDWTWVYRHPNFYVESGHMQGLGDELDYVAQSHSVVFDVAVQLGCWMGFSKIYLLGCDNTGDQHIYDYVGSKYPDPPVDMQKLQARLLGTSNAAAAAALMMQDHGRELIDCSIGGKLPLPKVPLAEVLGVSASVAP